MTEIEHVFVLHSQGQYDDCSLMEGLFRKRADAQGFAEALAEWELEWHEASWSKDGEYMSALSRQIPFIQYWVTKESLR